VKLHLPFVQLPLTFDAEALAAEALAIDEAQWKPHPQGFPGNSMLPLVAVNGDPDNESFAGSMRPTPHLLRCRYLQRVIASFGATVGRTRLMRLSGQSEVTRHIDQGYYWVERVRIHVPLVTQPTVRFECDDVSINMAAGECWLFDTWRQHCVFNDAERARIHLVCDSVGGPAFWDLVAQGRAHDAPRQTWRPRHIGHDPQADLESAGVAAPVAFACERVNVPNVMSPWELSEHLGFIFGECLPHPQLQILQRQAARLIRMWKGLWAQYGEGEDGRAVFRATFEAFMAAVRAPAQGVMLRNELAWFEVVEVMLGRVVVAAAHAGANDAAAQRAIGDNA
jgi:Aspartyl/Asparaginyl beta-hydroxylase